VTQMRMPSFLLGISSTVCIAAKTANIAAATARNRYAHFIFLSPIVTDETRAGERGMSPFELLEMLSGKGTYDLGHIPRVVLWPSGSPLEKMSHGVRLIKLHKNESDTEQYNRNYDLEPPTLSNPY
jgi:hypothetical protein